MVVPNSNDISINSYPVFHNKNDLNGFLQYQKTLVPEEVYNSLKVIEVSIMVDNNKPFLQAINK